MLHVTNGDQAADKIRRTGLRGTVLPWRDVLHEGPVPEGLELADLSFLRAEYIAAMGWDERESSHAIFAARDATLEAACSEEEVVLWFEHDLYDQLQLLQILDFFAGHPPDRLSLVQSSDYLGPASSELLLMLFARREPVSAAQLTLAARAWAAYRAPSPVDLVTLMSEDTAALPFLSAAIRRHLQQFPSCTDGLSRSERQALISLRSGPMTRDQLFQAHNAHESSIFLGDTTFFAYLDALASGPEPLLRWEESAPRRVVLTDAGHEVLDGREDALRLRDIDRWLGGVHLRSGNVWRWDEASGTVLQAER